MSKVWNPVERQTFRNSLIWQIFRSSLIASRKHTCELCGKICTKDSGLNVHHMFATGYDNLDPDRFKVLCVTCHLFVHKQRNTPVFKNLVGRRD